MTIKPNRHLLLAFTVHIEHVSLGWLYALSLSL